jgi:uncharacterized protein (DUF2062 family)
LPTSRNFWQRRLADPLVQQLTQGVSPRKIALTIAVGSAFALFPVLGTTTVLCLLAGIVLRLNQPIIQGINAIFFFIYFPALVGFVRVGDVLTRTAFSSLDVKSMLSLFRQHPAEFFRRFGVTGLHAVLGWVVVMPLLAALVYFLALFPLRAAARRLAQH